MRRATDSDIFLAHDSEEDAGTIPAVHNRALAAPTAHKQLAEECGEEQRSTHALSVGGVRIQRSLTWTEGSNLQLSQQGI